MGIVIGEVTGSFSTSASVAKSCKFWSIASISELYLVCLTILVTLSQLVNCKWILIFPLWFMVTDHVFCLVSIQIKTESFS